MFLMYYSGQFQDYSGLGYTYTITTDVWYHLVYSIAKSGGITTISIYINGGPNGNGTTPNYTTTGGVYTNYTTTFNYIGRTSYSDSNLYANGFSGYMNNYYYFPRSLSSAEINKIYKE
jgi:hypothetical protein